MRSEHTHPLMQVGVDCSRLNECGYGSRDPFIGQVKPMGHSLRRHHQDLSQAPHQQSMSIGAWAQDSVQVVACGVLYG